MDQWTNGRASGPNEWTSGPNEWTNGPNVRRVRKSQLSRRGLYIHSTHSTHSLTHSLARECEAGDGRARPHRTPRASPRLGVGDDNLFYRRRCDIHFIRAFIRSFTHNPFVALLFIIRLCAILCYRVLLGRKKGSAAYVKWVVWAE